MVHHLWYGSFDAEADDVRPRKWRSPLIRQPKPRHGGARRAVGRTLIEIGERISKDSASNTQAAGE